MDPSKVTADDIVGGVSSSTGAETGLEVVRQVYPKIGYVPGILLAPRFSRNANVCAALQAKCRSINSVFNCVCFVDIDSTAEGAVKYQDVAAQKVAQAATSREAYGLWPYCKVGDVVYSGSSMAAAVTVYNDTQYGDVPNASPSNVTAPITAACLADGTEVLIDQEQGNVLNENGIATWVRAQSRFVLWGNETCAYPSTTDPKDMFLCIRRFFNYTAANFVLNNQQKLDKPMNRAAGFHHRQREHAGAGLCLHRRLRQLRADPGPGPEHRRGAGGGPHLLLPVLHPLPAHEAGHQHHGVPGRRAGYGAAGLRKERT